MTRSPLATNNITFNPEGYYRWLSDGTYYDTHTTPANPFPLPRSRMTSTYAFPSDVGYVSIASGASLAVEGATLSVSKLRIGVGGMGTFSGLDLAASGTLDVVCDLSARPKSVTIPVDFTKFGDNWARIREWGVTVNGADPDRYHVAVTESGITLTLKGMMILVR